MKAIELVMRIHGKIYAYMPEHVDIRIVDVNAIEAGEPKTQLPLGMDFKHLVAVTAIDDYVEFICPKCGLIADCDHITSTAHCKCEGDYR